MLALIEARSASAVALIPARLVSVKSLTLGTKDYLPDGQMLSLC
jgi:hypothetical protein